MPEPDDNLVFKIDNKRPVSLEDFANSARAFGRIYEDYIDKSGVTSAANGTRFYIKDLRSGSLIAVLQPLADQADFISKHVDLVVPFLHHFKEYPNSLQI